MAAVNVVPNAAYAFSSPTIAYVGGGTDYTVLSDASDTSYVTHVGANSFSSWPLDDMPSTLGTVTGVTVNIRAKVSSTKGDYLNLQSVQIFKSDGSTAITDVMAQAATGTIATYNLTASTISYADKTSWDGAVCKVLSNAGTAGSLWTIELDVDLTYTPKYRDKGAVQHLDGNSNRLDKGAVEASAVAAGGTAPKGVFDNPFKGPFGGPV